MQRKLDIDMGSFFKWIGVVLGFTFKGSIGAILGFALGKLIDGFSAEEWNEYGNRATTSPQSGDFVVSLLLLSATVIKADGKVDPRELKYVQKYFTKMYGRERANKAFKLFKVFIQNNDYSLLEVCTQMRQNLQHSSRLQLIHYLFGIASADGSVNQSEVSKIKTIASYLYVNSYDFESIKAMFYKEYKTYYNPYKVLEIDRSATDNEVKKAYRKMVKKYHPDKLQHLGKEHLKGAEEKFMQVQKAYEQIQKERGF